MTSADLLIPIVAFLDEATHALPLEFGQRVGYRTGKKHGGPVRVGDRTLIRLRHDLIDDVEVLQITGGKFQFR